VKKHTLLKLSLGAVIFYMAFLLAQAEASEFQLLKLQDASIRYRSFKDGARNAFVYPETPKDGLGASLDMDVLHYFYWNNTVDSIATNDQFRAVWLNSRLGVRLSETFSIQFNHQSSHILDASHSFMSRFPVEDSIDLIITLRKRAEPAPVLFK
jgi:hypothetical protein